MSKNKSVFQRNSNYIEYAKSFEKIFPVISFNIRNYGIKHIFDNFHQDNNCLNQFEKKELVKNIHELKIMKQKLGNNVNCTKEEYEEFLNQLFHNVDTIDREGEVNVQTALSFKIIGELIDLLNNYGKIEDEWIKKKKYCKFKCIDIVKSLKAGEQPRRGNPQEADLDNQINLEFNTLVQDEMKKEEDANTNIKGPSKDLMNNYDSKQTESNYKESEKPEGKENDINLINKLKEKKLEINPNFFVKRDKEKSSEMHYPNIYAENKSNSENRNKSPSEKYNLEKIIEDTYHSFIINSKLKDDNTITTSKNLSGEIKSTNENDFTFSENKNKSLPYKEEISKINSRKSPSKLSPQKVISPKNIPSSNQIISSLFHSLNPENKEELVQHIIDADKTFLKPKTSIGDDLSQIDLITFEPLNRNKSKPKVNEIIFKSINQINFKMPVRKSSPDFNLLIKLILQHIEQGNSELDYIKIDYAINHIEMALYYLYNLSND